MNAYYKIADLTLQIKGRGAQLEGLDGFRPFRVECTDTPIATITLDDSLDECDFEAADWIYSSGEDGVTYDFGHHTEGFCCRLTTREGQQLKLWHCTGCDTIRCNADLIEGYAPYELRFLLWIAYGLAVLPYGAVAVHTSVIMQGGRAYMFLGESGTGKSTHTRLWRENIEGAELLNDDSPILRIVDGKPIVYGSPWSGKTPCYKPLSLPLGGVTRLSQAPHNRMRALGKLEAFGALLPSCPPNFAYDEALTDRMCEIIGAVIKTTPIYHLECLPDRAAAELSFNTLSNGR
ncbi:MAG: hypothetical protein J6V43_05640 [Rikenellaceae bacterium]|nr:hypothetical protein [Rikenellaceae bacterium]